MRREKEHYTSSTLAFESMLRKSPSEQHYVLRLYVTGTTCRSAQAIETIRSLCEDYLAGHYELKVVDIYQEPAAARAEQIIVAPTLVKSEPLPARRLTGDLSDREKILAGLDLANESHENEQ